jgi:predicted amidohydrolase YtcJ
MATTVSTNTPQDAVAYINGQIYTVNASRPWVEAFIVSPDGHFSAIGSTKDIRAQALEQGLVIYDLRNHFVMPGIHDAHMHVLYSGLAMLGNVPLPLDTTADNLAERIKEGACTCAYAHAFGNWILGDAFHIPDFDRKCLDAEFADEPVYIMAGAGHSMYANAALLKQAGYDVEDEPDSQAARIVRREDGSLTGELSEAAMNKAALALPKPALSHVKRALKTGIKAAHKVGVTSLQEASANTLQLQALSEMDKEGSLNMDVYAHIVDSPEFLSREPRPSTQALIEDAEAYASQHVHTNFVKFILDGVPLPPLFTHCELDAHNQPDQSKLIVPDLRDRILHHDKHGRTIKIHATGHGSVRYALDAITAARQQNPNGPKHEIAHCNSVHEDEFPRFKQLDVTAEMSPAFFFDHPLAASAPETFAWSFDTFVSQDALVTVGSDWDGGFEPGLLPHCAWIAEKVGKGDRAKGGELLCYMLTLAGARAVGREKEVGSIEVGKKANFIAVSSNLAKGEVEEARVVRTWFEGEMVWEENEK